MQKCKLEYEPKAFSIEGGGLFTTEPQWSTIGAKQIGCLIRRCSA